MAPYNRHNLYWVLPLVRIDIMIGQGCTIYYKLQAYVLLEMFWDGTILPVSFPRVSHKNIHLVDWFLSLSKQRASYNCTYKKSHLMAG